MTHEDMPADQPPTPASGVRSSSRFTRLVASQRFQRWAARFPLTRRIVKSEGEAMFDLVAGFCHTQLLQAFVRFGIPDLLLKKEMTVTVLAEDLDVPQGRLEVLLAGCVAIGLIKRRKAGFYALTRRGAALAGVPGLAGMIDHHEILYLDLADPVAFFRGEIETELAEFWPYVFGAKGVKDPNTIAQYSKLMADSLVMVAQDTLDAVRLDKAHRLMDVGGGSGAFIAAVAKAYPKLPLTLFDLPAVVPAATARFEKAQIQHRIDVVPGSFRDEDLPLGADIVTLVRILYDHADDTVASLLSNVYESLPPGGRIIVSEPMTGGATPERAGDAYFALYCMAMRTGKARSQAQIATLLGEAGFGEIKTPTARRPFITSIVSGVRLD